ncbi:hypothetical protein F4808DRAFT_460698 [Astrocystis sublimbata]|nr:hypothetical protein F4808DRAFT_460698 [Astrocystis sublimbata]
MTGPFPSQPTGPCRLPQPIHISNSGGSNKPAKREANTPPEFSRVYTGEYRSPVRERVQRLRDEQVVSETVFPRPDTPYPNKHPNSDLATPPHTLPSTPKCPGAPRKRVSRARLSQRQLDFEEDILLDRDATEQSKQQATFLGQRLQEITATPEKKTPLRQSWTPLDLAAIDTKLQALLNIKEDGI